MDEFIVTWDDGCNKRPAAGVNNTPVGVIPDNTKFYVTAYFIPLGKTKEQEYWGMLNDGYWVALVYNSQVRAVLVSPVPTPEPPAVKPLTVTIEGPDYQTVVVTVNPK